MVWPADSQADGHRFEHGLAPLRFSEFMQRNLMMCTKISIRTGLAMELRPKASHGEEVACAQQRDV